MRLAFGVPGPQRHRSAASWARPQRIDIARRRNAGFRAGSRSATTPPRRARRRVQRRGVQRGQPGRDVAGRPVPRRDPDPRSAARAIVRRVLRARARTPRSTRPHRPDRAEARLPAARAAHGASPPARSSSPPRCARASAASVAQRGGSRHAPRKVRFRRARVLGAIEVTARAARVAFGEPGRRRAMQLAPRAMQQRRVGAVANQRVREHEHAGLAPAARTRSRSISPGGVVGWRRRSARAARRDRIAGRSRPPPAARACRRAEAGRGARARRSGSTPEPHRRRSRCAAAGRGTADCPARDRRSAARGRATSRSGCAPAQALRCPPAAPDRSASCARRARASANAAPSRRVVITSTTR